MYINKYFKEYNIEPISEIDIREKCQFANKAAILLLDAFPNYNLDYLKIVELLQHTEMYISKIPKNISPVNYSYVDETMYISEDIELDLENKYVLHEVIHRIQEGRNKKEKLVQLGICNILETKIKGLAINEAAVQYIVEKILGNKREYIEVYEMKIPSISKDYYPVMTNLIEQLAFILGESILIDSVLNSNEEFKYNAIDELGEDNFYIIQSNFDRILEIKNSTIENTEISEIEINVNRIKELYIATQQLILTSYFDRTFKRIEKIEELKSYQKKLDKYREYIGSDEGQMLYFEYYKQQIEKIKTLQYKLENMQLVPVTDNKILGFFRKIKNYIASLIYKKCMISTIFVQRKLLNETK